MNQDQLAQAGVGVLGLTVIYFAFFRKKKKPFKAARPRSSPITAGFKYT